MQKPSPALSGSVRFYANALGIFIVSRLIVVAAVRFGTLLTFDQTHKWYGGDAWYYRLARWDTGWYATIVDQGYRYSSSPTDQGSVNFFPLYPLSASAVKAIFGVDSLVALLIVANISSIFAVLLLAKLAKSELGEQTATIAVTFFCLYPSSIFLSAGYSEPLCLTFVLLALVAMAQERFALSAIAAGIATAARHTSIVLLPVMLVEIWRASRPFSIRSLPKIAICALLATSGLLAYMTYLWINFDAPLAFIDAQRGWSHGTISDRLVAAATLRPFRVGELRNISEFLAFFVLSLVSFRCLRLSLALYGLAVVLMAYCLDGISPSSGRYLLMCVPAFMCIASICEKRTWLITPTAALGAALLFRKAALFSQWHWEG